jgi:TetR/AcrR family transcriptional repressor of mexJK operon
MDSSIAGRVRRPAPAAGSTAATPRRRVRGRSPGKRLAILAAARDLFLDKGFAGTSMDDVAARSGVSKQTVYAHFADKQRLFTELIRADVGQSDEPDHPMAATMGDTDDVARDLREYARWHLSVVLQPHRLRLRRTLIGEAERFPELARAWYENGPERSARIFAAWFRALDRRGVLAVPDPDLAAQHFNWLIVSIPVNKAMAGLLDGPLPTPELHRIADEGVRVFLAAYGVPQDHQTGATPACRPGA